MQAPLSAVRIDLFKFIQKSVFDYNTCTAKGTPLTVNCDSQ